MNNQCPPGMVMSNGQCIPAGGGGYRRGGRTNARRLGGSALSQRMRVGGRTGQTRMLHSRYPNGGLIHETTGAKIGGNIMGDYHNCPPGHVYADNKCIDTKNPGPWEHLYKK